MSASLNNLEARRGALLAALSGLHDMRPGSIVGAIRRCGKPGCHCAQAGDPGHGPNLRITYKARGKTVTEALPSSAAVRKAEQEIAEFRRFQELSEELVEVSGQICHQRPVEDKLTAEEKNGPQAKHHRGVHVQNITSNGMSWLDNEREKLSGIAQECVRHDLRGYFAGVIETTWIVLVLASGVPVTITF
jgi:hypothetical protein